MDTDKIKSIKDLDFDELISIVRKKGRKKKNSHYTVDEAYNEILRRMKPDLCRISHKFFIPGCSYDDIYQESLWALRYKAIKDYDRTKGRDGKPYPFNKFANLCIRRHLSSALQRSFRKKQEILNTSISLDQNRSNNDGEDSLFLSDILSTGDKDVLETLGQREYYKNLFNNLFLRLSKFEKRVFCLYVRKYSYEDITGIINKYNIKKGLKTRISIKSVDNALSRIKQKAKIVFKKYGND